MAINISFNNTNYSIDESSLSSALAALKSHLSTTMNGTGATIVLDGVSYSINAAKLSAAEDEFASYLSAIGGDAPAEERLEGDGQEYYTLAPTALTFRSTEPLAEFQEVRVNGQVVDPANYTLEEGSTIVKLSIDYLKTLPVGAYNIEVASANNTPSGGFTVAAPKLNELGFYYNQPYAGIVYALNAAFVIIFREDGKVNVIDFVNNTTEVCDYSIDGDSITVISAMGEFHATVSADGIYVVEFGTTFVLGLEGLISDGEYIYEPFNIDEVEGYNVRAVIDNTKTSYRPILSGINGKPLLKLDADLFKGNTNLTSLTIPDSVEYIGGEAFKGCTRLKNIVLPDSMRYFSERLFEDCTGLTSITIPYGVAHIGYGSFLNCVNLKEIIFEGTIEQWNAIGKANGWNQDIHITYVQCTDGQVAL